MSLPETPVGGATLRPGHPQPKGRPTAPWETVCPRCSLHECMCGDPLAESVHAFTLAGGIPLPLSMCHRLAVALRRTYRIEVRE